MSKINRAIDILWAKCRSTLNWFMFGSRYRCPYEVHPTTIVYNYKNIVFDKTGNIFKSPGCVYNAAAKITIGSHTWIGMNVGLITQNHDLYNPDEVMEPEPIWIGDYCWIGMNSVILPGITLGDHTVVGAGSVVTKSFPDGLCVIAGSPARLIRNLKEGNHGD